MCVTHKNVFNVMQKSVHKELCILEILKEQMPKETKHKKPGRLFCGSYYRS